MRRDDRRSRRQGPNLLRYSNFLGGLLGKRAIQQARPVRRQPPTAGFPKTHCASRSGGLFLKLGEIAADVIVLRNLSGGPHAPTY
jgi:hypothetical protein